MSNRVILIELIVFAASWIGAPLVTYSQTGKLVIHSAPSGAKVFHGRSESNLVKAKQKTPTTLDLKEGYQYIKIVKDGYEPVIKYVQIIKSKTESVSLSLAFEPKSSAILSGARDSYNSGRSKFTITNSAATEFFRGSSVFLDDLANINKQYRRLTNKRLPVPEAGGLSMAGLRPQPGSIVVVYLKGDLKKLIMVYAGEFRFSDDQSNVFRSFYYFPYLDKSGLQLSTYPPRWDKFTLETHGLVSNTHQKTPLEKAGTSHQQPGYANSSVDMHEIDFLHSPTINGSLFFLKSNHSSGGEFDVFQEFVTLDLLANAFPATKRSTLQQFIEPLNYVCKKFKINSEQRIAAFLAQVGYESQGFSRTVENLNYTKEQLLEKWPSYFTPETAKTYEKHPVMIANYIYGNRKDLGNDNEKSGDGWKYRGRGLIQLTGRNNYKAYSDYSEVKIDKLFELLEQADHACSSSGWYWETNKLNQLADKGDIKQITKIINGGYNGLAERQNLYERINKLLKE